MRRLLLAMMAVILAVPLAWAAPTTKAPSLDATFSTLNGKVTIKNAKGKPRAAKKTSTVPKGSTVITSKTGTATLKFFDGSSLDIKSNSSVLVSEMQKPSALEKIIHFKLGFGELVAQVSKLLTPKSSFEIEAGGVVCGVRGTKYSINYDAEHHHLHLHVYEGTVYADVNGVIHLFMAGQDADFENGHIVDKGGSKGGPSPDWALGDLDEQFWFGMVGNGSDFANDPFGDNTNQQTSGGTGNVGSNNYSDPGLGGYRVNVSVNVGAVEAVP